MKVTKKSLVTGKVSTVDILVTQSELDRHSSGELAYIIWPNLSDSDLRFLIYGITREEHIMINKSTSHAPNHDI